MNYIVWLVHLFFHSWIQLWARVKYIFIFFNEHSTFEHGLKNYGHRRLQINVLNYSSNIWNYLGFFNQKTKLVPSNAMAFVNKGNHTINNGNNTYRGLRYRNIEWSPSMTMARFTIVIQIRFSNAFSTKIHQFRVFCSACYLSTVTGEQISISFIVSSRISIWSLSTVRSATWPVLSTSPPTHWLVFFPYNQHRLCSCTTPAVIHRYFLRLRGDFFFL